jgi:hypothetical protein
VRGRLATLAVSGLVVLLVIWAVYGFEVQNSLPAATFWRGLWKIWSEYSLGLPSYLMGEINRTGWWHYFPVTFALKTPLPVFILCGLGLAALARRPSVERRPSLVVIIPPVISMLAVLFSPLAFGYRHILPILPFVIILASNAINLGLPFRSRFTFHVLRFAGYALLAWLAISTALIFPHHLSYFNELAGGPENADRFLVDSNLDWGQDLAALKAQMERLGLERVNLSYYGTALPAAYGVRYWPMPAFLHFVIGPEIDSYNPYTPEPGWYAVSVTSLRMGLLWREPDLYAYFRDKTPVARAGYSIRLYQVEYPENTPVDRTIVVGDSVFAIDPQMLGVQPGRRLIAKWADNPNVFIFAMSGPARYLTPDPFPFDRDTRRAFRAAARQDGQALILDARAFVEPRLAEWRATLPNKTPVSFDGKLALMGYRLTSPDVARGDSLDLITYWQVTGALAPSLAFFAHVLDEQQNIVGQYDGWGTAIRGLEIGDVIVQRVRVPIHVNTSPGAHRLQLGVYSTDTLARWPARGDAGARADHVALATINVH